MSTAAKVLRELEQFDIRQTGRNKYRLRSPFRPESDNPNIAELTINDEEHGVLYDFHAETAYTLYQLADHLSIEVPPLGDNFTTKRRYHSLADYAHAHHVTEEVFQRAGWKQGQYQNRPCLIFPTKTGKRYRFIDGNEPAYKHQTGCTRSWYGLPQAVQIAIATQLPLILCNGEASTVVAQHYNLPACCVTLGEKSDFPDPLLQELLEVWEGKIVVAFDSDKKGREAGPKLARFLTSNGYDALAIDLAPDVDNGFDLADFCGKHGIHAPLALEGVLTSPPPHPDNALSFPPSPSHNFPPLPGYAKAVYQYLDEERIAWLLSYIDYGREVAPMTPRSFHEAAGLFAASTIIARRLRLTVGNTHIYPNLFYLFVAPSTVYSKTTGLRVVAELFERTGLTHHLLPQRMTPEAMLQELSLSVPSALNNADDITRSKWLAERAFAAKRGWMIDEAHSLLDGLKRDFNTGLLALLLNLYECPRETTEQTVGRWRTTIQDAYISFFGATTPAAVGDHLANPLLWSNGLFPRFAFVLPDAAPSFQFFPDYEISMPRHILDGFLNLAELFPTPTAELVDVELEEGGKQKVVEIHGEEPPLQVQLGEGVWQCWEAYNRATRFDLLSSDGLDEEVYGSYGRLGTMVMKIAMLLAALDSPALPVQVELCHYAHAQEITESYRRNLHTLRREKATTKSEKEIDKIVSLLEQHPDGCAMRDIYRVLHLDVKTTRERLEELAKQGVVKKLHNRPEIWGKVA